MGYSIPLMIHNDGVEELLRDPRLGEKLVGAIREASLSNKRVEVAVGNHANLIQVMPMHHADDARYYKVDGNLMVPVKFEDRVTKRKSTRKPKPKTTGLRINEVNRFRYAGIEEWRPVGSDWWRLRAAIRQGRQVEVRLYDGTVVTDPVWAA